MTGRHQPFQLTYFGLSALAGAALLVGGRRPPSLMEYPQWISTAWAACLVSYGVVGLVGSYWRGHVVTGLLLERAALLVAAAAGIVYDVAIFAGAGWGAAGAAVWVTAYTVACLARANDIRDALTDLGGRERS